MMSDAGTAAESEAAVEAEAEMEEERETTPPQVRKQVLDRDKHRCQICGALGLSAGGAVALEVHHKMANPPDCDRHDPANLITLCEDCHSWAHKKPTGEELPITITDADRQSLLPHDYQILQILRRDGPAMTGEIQDALPLDLSAVAVRERLYLMMGMDHEVESRDEPLIDQDAVTGEWGLPDQIAESARGRIPEDTQLLIRRVHDERVLRALDRGCNRQMVAEAYGISERTTWHKQRRAQAYEFPLDAFDGPGPGVGGVSTTGRANVRDSGDESSDGDRDGERTGEQMTGAEQLRLDTVPGEDTDGAADSDESNAGSAADAAREGSRESSSTPELGVSQASGDEVEVWPPNRADQEGASEVEPGDNRDADTSDGGPPADKDALQSQLDRAIAALQMIDASINRTTE